MPPADTESITTSTAPQPVSLAALYKTTMLASWWTILSHGYLYPRQCIAKKEVMNCTFQGHLAIEFPQKQRAARSTCLPLPMRIEGRARKGRARTRVCCAAHRARADAQRGTARRSYTIKRALGASREGRACAHLQLVIRGTRDRHLHSEAIRGQRV